MIYEYFLAVKSIIKLKVIQRKIWLQAVLNILKQTTPQVYLTGFLFWFKVPFSKNRYFHKGKENKIPYVNFDFIFIMLSTKCIRKQQSKITNLAYYILFI